MKRIIELTEDGSHTLFIPEMDEHFHSTHGAIQESMHVFIENGLKQTYSDKLTIFEVGFGTGLNALLTLLNGSHIPIDYYSIEKYPLSKDEFASLNYAKKLHADCSEVFQALHECAWDQLIEITPNFRLHKINGDLQNISLEPLPLFDLIYFDAFAPSKQPEMWQEAMLKKIATHTKKGGIFSTYTAKGDVRRSLIRLGFNTKRIPGPPGKKEILFGEKA